MPGKAPSLPASSPGCWPATRRAAGQAQGRIPFEVSGSSWSAVSSEPALGVFIFVGATQPGFAARL